MTPSDYPIVRSARLADLPEIEEMEVATFGADNYPYFTLRQLFELDGDHWVVLERYGNVHGYAILSINTKGTAWLMALTVRPESRKNNYGTDLVKACQKQCHDSGKVSRLFVTVDPTNGPACKIYDRLGFRLWRHEREYFGASKHRNVLVYELEGALFLQPDRPAAGVGINPVFPQPVP